jgi:predicted metal-dependent hydrolase/Ni,Fe-hydrogenase maturation factor
MDILVFGNALHKTDSLPLRLLPALKKEFAHVNFREFDTVEDLEGQGRELIILDVVKGIKHVEVIDAVERFENSPAYTLHDFDLALSLKLLTKIGKIEQVTVIGIPENMKKREATIELKKAIYPLVGESRKITINGKEYNIVRLKSRNKNASARLTGDIVVVKLPVWWPNHTREKIAKELENRAVRSIERKKWTGKMIAPLDFSYCKKFVILGKEYTVKKEIGKRNSCCLISNTFVVSLNNEKKLSELIKKEITKNILPEVECRVKELNGACFQSEVTKVRLRDNITRWGSWCNGKMTLNMRLLFGPSDILDYVIVHELAHSRIGRHNRKFWKIVEGIIPDYRKRRKWMRENADKLGVTVAT